MNAWKCVQIELEPAPSPAFPWHGRGCAHGLSVRIVYATLEIGTETSNLGCSRRENANINFATGLWKMQWRMVKDRRRGRGGKGKEWWLRAMQNRYNWDIDISVLNKYARIAFVPPRAVISSLYTTSAAAIVLPMKRRLTYLPTPTVPSWTM